MGKKNAGVEKLDNLEIDEKENYVLVSVNPKIFPMDIVYSASYAFMDRAFLVLDGDPKKEIKVKLRPKKNIALKKLGTDFNDELLNYSVYKVQSEKNKLIKEAIVQKALFWDKNQGVSEDTSDSYLEEDSEDPSDGDSYLDDPLGIAKPWEESHGKYKK